MKTNLILNIFVELVTRPENKDILNILNDRKRFEDVFQEVINEDSFNRLYCDVGIENSCLQNEECIPRHPKTGTGN